MGGTLRQQYAYSAHLERIAEDEFQRWKKIAEEKADYRIWRATKPFTDFDGVQIQAGQVIGAVSRRGYSKVRKKWFWNGLLDGKVTCVTVGFPPFCEPVTSE